MRGMYEPEAYARRTSDKPSSSAAPGGSGELAWNHGTGSE